MSKKFLLLGGLAVLLLAAAPVFASAACPFSGGQSNQFGNQFDSQFGGQFGSGFPQFSQGDNDSSRIFNFPGNFSERPNFSRRHRNYRNYRNYRNSRPSWGRNPWYYQLQDFNFGPESSQGCNSENYTPCNNEETEPIEGAVSLSMEGTVSAISGNTLTVAATNGTVYTVDAASAKFKSKNGDDAALSLIQVNDKLFVQGTLPTNAVNVSAAKIKDLSR